MIFFCFPSLVVYMSPSCVIIARLAMTVLHHVSSVIVKWTRILLMTLKEENKKFPVLSPFDRINCFIKCGNQLHAIIIEQSKHHKNACPHWCELTFQFSFVHISFFQRIAPTFSFQSKEMYLICTNQICWLRKKGIIHSISDLLVEKKSIFLSFSDLPDKANTRKCCYNSRREVNCNYFNTHFMTKFFVWKICFRFWLTGTLLSFQYIWGSTEREKPIERPSFST